MRPSFDPSYLNILSDENAHEHDERTLDGDRLSRRVQVRFQFPIQAPDESVAARIEEVLKVPSVSSARKKFSTSSRRAPSK
jgi:hypothetical protein